MSRMQSSALIAAVLALPALAMASPKLDDFAWQWPLSVEAGGVHRLVLTPEIYRSISRSDARDLAVFTSDGRPVSFGPLAPPPETPWRDAPYALEITTQSQEPVGKVGQRLSLSASVRLSLHLRSRVPEAANMRVLRVLWRHSMALPADASWRVEAGRGRGAVHADVLAHSYSLASGIGETRLALQDFDGDSLRLTVSPVPAGLGIDHVLAEYEAIDAEPRMWWRAALRSEDAGKHQRFDLPPALPVSAARISLGEGGALATIQLAVLEGQYWRELARDTAFDVAVGDANFVRNRLAFASTRQSSWRLQLDPPMPAPIVELGYRPDVYLIAHPGPAELVLAAGSARSVRGEAPIETLMQELRVQFGPGYRPPEVALGARSERSGSVMLQPPPPPPPYRAWILWSVLGATAVALTVIALRLLREPDAAAKAQDQSPEDPA